MPLVNHVGGSITGAVVALLAVLALGARVAWKRRPSRPGSGRAQQAPVRPPRFLGAITPAALRLLIETRAVPHVVVQLCQPEEPPPLPPALAHTHDTIILPHDTAAAVLMGPPSLWRDYSTTYSSQAAPAPAAAASAAPVRGPQSEEPRRGELVCLVTASETLGHACACALAANGFQRVALTVTSTGTEATTPDRHFPGNVVTGAGMGTGMGMGGGMGASPSSPSSAVLWGGQAVQITYIQRDGLAALLGYRNQPLGVPYVLLDVRRHDERTLYGLLRGSVHVPVEQLPSALSLSPDEFLALYRFARPQPGCPLVLVGRTSKRAAWAAQVCEDAGLWPVLVYRQGVQGWRLDESVKPYSDYRVGDRPPEPEVFQLEMPDEDRGLEELFTLGLLQRQ